MKKISIYIICTIWLIIDQIIKGIVVSYLNVGEKINVISNFFKINYLQNEGAAFSSFTGMSIINLYNSNSFLYDSKLHQEK